MRSNCLSALVLLLAALLRPLPLEVSVQARELVPGDPLRLDVVAPEPLRELSASFLGEPIRFTPIDDSGRRWRGWSLIPLDQTAGSVSIELSGTTATGGEAIGMHALAIAAKSFPEENLSVAPKYVEPPAEVQRRIERERAKLKKIYAVVGPDRTDGEPFLRPVDGINTSTFGKRRLFNGKPRSPHPGLDMRAATGTEIANAGPGRVVLAQDLYYAGNTVIVDHGAQLFTIYAHLSRIDVAVGDELSRGDRVGLSGATGRVTGPHLHWGAKVGDRPFDPEALLDPTLLAD